jgi:Pyruvate/2-oxoacid:ferredoxin oxidoreductase delta subunit
VYLYVTPATHPYWWAPIIGLAVLMLALRQWSAMPFVAMALLVAGFYVSKQFGPWEFLGMSVTFWYAVLYTIAVVAMGVRFLRLYWGRDRYMVIRTFFNMFAQLVVGFALAFWLPWEWGGGAEDSPGNGVFFMYYWPLEENALVIGEYGGYTAVVKTFLIWNVIAALVIMPVLVYFYGKRPYCAWLCGCGCLAETLGDPFRRLTPRSRLSRRVEPVIYPFVAAAVGFTAWVLLAPDSFSEQVFSTQKWYGIIVKFFFASFLGVGLYTLMGARIWCRYFCPWAGLFGIVAKFGRYAIRTRGELCIACGMCNTYCEMGIDIRGFAMRGEPVKTPTCVGCGMCIEKCPRRVLSFTME